MAGASLRGGRCPPPGPPILGFLPLVAGNNREEVNKEDFDDFDDTDDRAAHPQTQLSTEVGQEHLNLQGRPSNLKAKSSGTCLQSSTRGAEGRMIASSRPVWAT